MDADSENVDTDFLAHYIEHRLRTNDRRVRPESRFHNWITTFLIDQFAFRSAEVEGKQPVRLGVLF